MKSKIQDISQSQKSIFLAIISTNAAPWVGCLHNLAYFFLLIYKIAFPYFHSIFFLMESKFLYLAHTVKQIVSCWRCDLPVCVAQIVLYQTFSKYFYLPLGCQRLCASGWGMFPSLLCIQKRLVVKSYSVLQKFCRNNKVSLGEYDPCYLPGTNTNEILPMAGFARVLLWFDHL